MSKQKAEVEQILKDYGNDPVAIQEAIYGYLKESKIPYIKPLDSGLFEIYDGKKTSIVDQKVVDKLKKESIQQTIEKAQDEAAKSNDASKAD